MRRRKSEENAEARVLAIDPVNRGYGFVVFEGPERLIDWGVARVVQNSYSGSLDRIDALIDHYRPDGVILEDCKDKWSRRGLRARRLIGAITRLARARGLELHTVSRTGVRKAFADAGAVTKEEIAAEIASRFPELAPRLPPPRKVWMPEDRRMAIFDAASFALAYFHFQTKGQLSGAA